jgi:hypothetical protein
MFGSQPSSRRHRLCYHILAGVQEQSMNLRYALSALGRSAARRAFGRTWMWVCAAGAFVTILVVGPRHAFFALVVWMVCIFAPVRIAVEVLHSRGPMLRRELMRSIEERDDRYASPEHVALMVEALFAKEVLLPRLAPPDLRDKVIDAATRVSRSVQRDRGGPPAVLHAATVCAALLRRWTDAIAAGEAGAPPGAANGAAPRALWDSHTSVQDQWGTLRAVAGLAALTKTLIAVYEDSAGVLSEEGASMRALSEAAMDYVDQLGLRLDGPAWDVEGPAFQALPPERLTRLAEAWTTFCAAPAPAPRRLRAFVEAVDA